MNGKIPSNATPIATKSNITKNQNFLLFVHKIIIMYMKTQKCINKNNMRNKIMINVNLTNYKYIAFFESCTHTHRTKWPRCVRR